MSINSTLDPTIIELSGIGIVRITNFGSKENYEIIFQKGIGKSLIQNVIELSREDRKEKAQGKSIIPIDNFTMYINFFGIDMETDLFMIIYMDKKGTSDNYPKIYMHSKKLFSLISAKSSISEILNFCDSTINIPKLSDIKALIMLSASGVPLHSAINESSKDILNSEMLGGFISALYSFSQHVLNEKSGAKLKEINFGNQIFHMVVKKEIIVVYLVDKVNKFHKRYINIIADEFIEIYKDLLDNFSGDISPFSEFRRVIDQYFVI